MPVKNLAASEGYLIRGDAVKANEVAVMVLNRVAGAGHFSVGFVKWLITQYTYDFHLKNAIFYKVMKTYSKFNLGN